MSDHCSRPLEQKPIAWNNISIKVPLSWEIESLTKDHMIICEDHTPKLEIKWSEPKRKSSVEQFLKPFISQTQKNLGITIKESAQPQGFKEPDQNQDFLFFTWQGDSGNGNGCIVFCHRCGRLSLLRFFTSSFKDPSVIQDTIASFKDHTDKSSAFWSVFGMQFFTPNGSKLIAYDFKPGALNLSFKQGRVTFTLYSWGPANFLLSDKRLDQFANERLKLGMPFTQSGTENRGDFCLWEYQSGLTPYIRNIPLLSGLSQYSLFRVTHDTDQNRILGIFIQSPFRYERNLMMRLMIGER